MWAALALDYLPIMASSVSSECAFSSAGITISKRRNRLGADVVEALQFLKCWFRRELIFCEKTGWDGHIFGDEEDICGDDPEPDGDDDNDVFLFECM